MPLVSRPFSINTYCLSKVWFRTGSVDLRAGDIKAITSKIKSYVYQDLYQKPSEVLLYRDVGDGGLGLHHLESKALAHLIASFIQTAAGKRFQTSLFHTWLYRYHVLGETDLPDPGYTPYYSQKFFQEIRKVQEDSPLNPIYMTIKEWYRWLLEKNVIKREVDQEGMLELIPCKVEEREPDVFWAESYRISRLNGLSPTSKSFLFRLIHTLLPSKERLHHLTPQLSPLCPCNTGVEESYQHLFFQCQMNDEAGQALVRVISAYDRGVNESKALRLELQSDDPFLLSSAAILAVGLEFIWDNRRHKKTTSLFLMRTELETAISIRRRSRSRRIREMAGIMQNLVDNFLVTI